MLFAVLIWIGLGLGVVLGALAHPGIYRAVTGRSGGDADHRGC